MQSVTAGSTSEARAALRWLWAGTAALAIGLRWAYWPWASGDFRDYLVWYGYFTERGFAALGDRFYHYYNTPWPITVWLLSRLDGVLPPLALMKLALMTFDLLAAIAVHGLVRAARPLGSSAAIAFCAVLASPTVVMNAGVIVQCDGMWVAFVALSVLAVLRGRSIAAWAAFGVAISCKLQGIFVAPFLLAAVLAGRLSPWPVVVVPAILLVAMAPAWLAGRDAADLILVYARQSAWFPTLSSTAPNWWSFVDNRVYAFAYPFGLVLAMTGLLAYARMIQLARDRLDATALLHAACVSCALAPFLLPKMHDRYFFASDILAVALAAADPRYVLAAVALAFASALAYLPFTVGFDEALVPAALINSLTVPWLAGALALRLHPTAAAMRVIAPWLTVGALARGLGGLALAWTAWCFALGALAAGGWDVRAEFGNAPADLPGLAGFALIWALATAALGRRLGAVASAPAPRGIAP